MITVPHPCPVKLRWISSPGRPVRNSQFCCLKWRRAARPVLGSASLTLSEIVSSQWCGWAQDSASKASRCLPAPARGASRSSSCTTPQQPGASGPEGERAGEGSGSTQTETRGRCRSRLQWRKASGLLRQRAV